jgi:hypothetical protein
MTEATGTTAIAKPAPAATPDPTRRLTRLYLAALALLAAVMCSWRCSTRRAMRR